MQEAVAQEELTTIQPEINELTINNKIQSIPPIEEENQTLEIEEEWPSIKEAELPSLELSFTKAETDPAQIEEKIPEEEWPSIKNIEPKGIEEPEIIEVIAEKEEEWPSLGLSFASEAVDEIENKLETIKEKIAEINASMPEEEWPSLNLAFASDSEDADNK